jgi:PhnB protein
MQVQPYLFFEGRCEEALDFYRRTLGAEVTMLMRFKESPEPCEPGKMRPGTEDKVMHAELRIGETTVANETEVDRLFAALADGGQVQMPLVKTFFSPRFGMVADRFGVSWMLYVAPEASHTRQTSKEAVPCGS